LSASVIEVEAFVNPRNAPPRFFLVAAFIGASLALVAGCGGGGSSSGSPTGGGSLSPISTPTPTPIPSASPVVQTLHVGQNLTPSATFSPIPLSGVGSTVLTITAPNATVNATWTVGVQAAQPGGIPVPAAVLRRPEAINGQNIVSLAFVSIASSGTTTTQKTPSFSATFASPISTSAPYVYIAEYSASAQTWATIATGVLSNANKTATFASLTESETYSPAAATWFVIFTVSAALPTPTPLPSTATANPTAVPTTAPSAAPTIGATAQPLPDQLQFQATGLYGEIVAAGLPAPRQLVALPNGDLLVGTDDKSGTVWIVPNVEGAGAGGKPKVFTTVPNVSAQEPAQGLAFDGSNVYIATNQSVWQVPYHTGDQSEPTPTIEIAKVRRGGIAPNSDGDVHFTSSVAVVSATTPKMLYVGVGSSCNACVETDPTRGTIQQVNLSVGQSSQSLKAARFRNPLALAVNPATNSLWAGGAGQDDLLQLNGSVVIGVSNPLDGHPYEFFDPVTTHAQAIPDYGWPDCEENNIVYNPLNKPNASCKALAPATTGGNVVIPAVELFAYSTIIGATFYPANQTGTYVFPASYKGGAFLSMHGSWHESATSNEFLTVPELIYVSITNDKPTIAANYSNSGAQWQTVLYGFQDPSSGIRIGRPVGLTVGPQGSLFVSDDYAGVIYRIRPGTAPGSKTRRPR
jgi:glucose/arabinose dehydrogenase